MNCAKSPRPRNKIWHSALMHPVLCEITKKGLIIRPMISFCYGAQRQRYRVSRQIQYCDPLSFLEPPPPSFICRLICFLSSLHAIPLGVSFIPERWHLLMPGGYLLAPQSLNPSQQNWGTHERLERMCGRILINNPFSHPLTLRHTDRPLGTHIHVFIAFRNSFPW